MVVVVMEVCLLISCPKRCVFCYFHCSGMGGSGWHACVALGEETPVAFTKTATSYTFAVGVVLIGGVAIFGIWRKRFYQEYTEITDHDDVVCTQRNRGILFFHAFSDFYRNLNYTILTFFWLSQLLMVKHTMAFIK